MIKPTWEVGGNGDQSISRAGVILLEFAAVGGSQGAQSSYGSRAYDWTSKQVRAASLPFRRPGNVSLRNLRTRMVRSAAASSSQATLQSCVTCSLGPSLYRIYAGGMI